MGRRMGARQPITTQLNAQGQTIVYVPPGRDFFAVEPVSHVNNAVNRPDIADRGMRVLGPGERMAAKVRFGVEVLP